MPNNMILLETIALTQSAASVVFDNLPTSGYTDLKVVISGRCDSTSGFPETVNLRFNGSSAAEYSWRGLFSVTATPGSNNDTSVTLIRAGNVPSVAQTANTFSNTEIYIPNYRSSSNKSVSIDATTETNGNTDFTYSLIMNAGIRANTAAITAINLSLSAGNFVANSTFSLYGIAAFGTTPVLAPKATGGNIVANDGTYWIHTFLSSGTFTPQVGLTCDYLVVAGGGGAGNAYGGGGGAGGFLTNVGGSPLSVTTTSYAVTVGAGGAVQTNGANSIFSSVTATGGGKGGDGNPQSLGQGPNNGGSGGGVGGWTPSTNSTNTPIGTASPSGQGNNGGTSSGTGWKGGGGGGGAGAVGSNGSNNGSIALAGNGGAGLSSSISGTSVTYAGGGGGGAGFNGIDGTAGTGGAGGGGNGSNTGNGSPGTANTGGGGGGGDQNDTGGAGGSGIVIIRYPIN